MKKRLLPALVLMSACGGAMALGPPDAQTCYGGQRVTAWAGSIQRGDVLLQDTTPYAVTGTRRLRKPPQVSLALQNLVSGAKTTQNVAPQFEMVKLVQETAKIALGCRYAGARPTD